MGPILQKATFALHFFHWSMCAEALHHLAPNSLQVSPSTASTSHVLVVLVLTGERPSGKTVISIPVRKNKLQGVESSR